MEKKPRFRSHGIYHDVPEGRAQEQAGTRHKLLTNLLWRGVRNGGGHSKPVHTEEGVVPQGGRLDKARTPQPGSATWCRRRSINKTLRRFVTALSFFCKQGVYYAYPHGPMAELNTATLTPAVKTCLMLSTECSSENSTGHTNKRLPLSYKQPPARTLTHNARLPIGPEVPEIVLRLAVPPSVGPRRKQGLDEPHQGRSDHAQRAERGANRSQPGRDEHGTRREEPLVREWLDCFV